MSGLIYRQVEPISKADAEVVFAGGDSQKIVDALLGLAFFDDDLQWVQGLCIQYLSNEDNNLKAIAATCLGHLARIHRDPDTKKVIPLLKQLKNIPEIAGIVDDAIEDIKHFIRLSQKEASKADLKT